ncbi:MAG: glycosyltransferase [Psychroserpens sp.]|uniref:glycosyltransferase n=1 Tax=Psychroserpens sp. TaxID=2020870 RepID=UPI0030036670
MSKRIKILFTIPNFDTAGSGKVVYDLVKGLDKTRFEPEICCHHDRGAYFETIKTLGVKIHIFQFTAAYRPLLSLPFRVIKIARFLKRGKFDLIHSWHWSSDFTEPLAAKLVGIPFVYTKKAMGWGNKAWKWRSQLSTKIIVINRDMLDYYHGMEHKVESMPLGVDTNYYHPLPKSYDLPNAIKFDVDDFIIVSIANLVAVKGIEVLLEAVERLNDDNIKVLIVGSDHSHYAITLKQKYKSKKHIQFLGKQLDIKPYLAVANVFVIPTKNEGRKEGMPIAPLEAMASSRIVIGSNISGIKDILESKKEFLFEPSNIDDLAEKIKFVMNLTPADMSAKQQEFRNLAVKIFSIQSFITNHQFFYKQLLNVQ